MKPTLLNKAKLWWHCLIHFHRYAELSYSNEVLRIEPWALIPGIEFNGMLKIMTKNTVLLLRLLIVTFINLNVY